MSPPLSLNALWRSAPVATPLPLGGWEGFPAAAQRYLSHAIAPGTPLASAVRLRMHGQIKLKQWCPFKAEQVIAQRGMIWQATTWMNGLPILGADRLVDGAGAMRWKLLGLFPVMVASGADITRSGTGRAAGEAVWLPTMLWGTDTTWTATDTNHATAHFTRQNEAIDLHLEVDRAGRLQSLQFQRWGNPGGNEFSYNSFGGWVEAERTFGGYTIPSQLRLGWYFGSERFEPEGEFFRVTIDDAQYR